jgi:hypothetical protein
MDTTNQNKRKSASAITKSVSLTKHGKGNKDCYFYIALTMANIELIWCDEYEGQDAFTHPIYDHIVNRSKWMIDNNFIDFYAWRKHKEDNTIVYNTTASKVGQSVFPRRYYVRVVDPGESTTESRYNILVKCVEVMKQSATKLNYKASPTKMFAIHDYGIPLDYDKTPETLLPLDHYLLDTDIFTLIKKLFSEVTDWKRWAKTYIDDSPAYFSPLYSNRLEPLLLGYETDTKEKW